MPTYQYVCSECQEPLEAVQAFTDDALRTCPSCGAEALRKVYGSVGVVFKGSGFYRTDSRGNAATTGSTGTADTTSSPAAATPAPSTPAPSTPPASS